MLLKNASATYLKGSRACMWRQGHRPLLREQLNPAASLQCSQNACNCSKMERLAPRTQMAAPRSGAQAAEQANLVRHDMNDAAFRHGSSQPRIHPGVCKAASHRQLKLQASQSTICGLIALHLLFYFGSVFEPEFKSGSRSHANDDSKIEAKKPGFGFVAGW